MSLLKNVLLASCAASMLLATETVYAASATPVVVFPAFHFTKLKVKVHNQAGVS